MTGQASNTCSIKACGRKGSCRTVDPINHHVDSATDVGICSLGENKRSGPCLLWNVALQHVVDNDLLTQAGHPWACNAATSGSCFWCLELVEGAIRQLGEVVTLSNDFRASGNRSCWNNGDTNRRHQQASYWLYLTALLCSSWQITAHPSA